jgi:uncharacterized membrane protein
MVGSMNRNAKRLIWLLAGVAILAVIGVAAYNIGLAANHGAARVMFGPMRGYYGGAGFGFGGFGLFGALLVGFLLVWLFVGFISRPSGSGAPTLMDPAGVDRLRELSEMHDRGALSDDEFSAAKRKLLGL